MNQNVLDQRNAQKVILIVDDEESISRTLAQVLNEEGYSTLVANDGESALQAIREHQPDLVLLDIWMPGIDGLEVLRRIKEYNLGLPVLMMSGHAAISTAVQSTKLGAADFIEKPFDLDAILASVERWVEPTQVVAALGANSTSADSRVASLADYQERRLEQGEKRYRGPSVSPVVFREQAWAGRKIVQRTLKSSALLYGQCLHSGKKSGLVLEPLPANTGIHFAGVADGEAVPAHVDFVRSTGFATTLRQGTVRTGTVEHLLAAFHAYGVTNALIKCNGEVPAMDGSAKEFCELLEQVGLEEQAGDWFELAVPQIVRVGNDHEWIQIEPADQFSIDYYLSYPEPVGIQQLCYTLEGPEDFLQHIAGARTFSFLKDVGKLQQVGLAQGGRFDNFILIGEEGPLNVDLRFPDEFVRHKILDVIGDLYLLGRKLRGKVTACFTGHSDNIALLQAIQQAMRADTKG